MEKSNSGAKRSEKRLKLEKADLTKDLKFNFSLIKLAEKYDVSKSIIQTVLTNQLNEKKRIAEAKRSNDFDSGWEERQLISFGLNEWKDSPEREIIKNIKKELNN